MEAVITILDAITETSMPFNEFVLYRAIHFEHENHFLIICDSEKILPKVVIPDNLKIFYTGKNLLRIRKTIRRTINDCKKNKKKYVIHMHQNKSAFMAQVAMLGTSLNRKTIFTTHNTFTGYSFHNKILSFFNGFLAHVVNCVSITAYEHYPLMIKKIKGDRVLPIQNGVDTERIDKLSQEDALKSEKQVVFVYVARMVPVKNHDFLLNIIKQSACNSHFVFIGSIDSKIINRIVEDGLQDKIECTGLIPRDEVYRRLKQSDVYISSSVLEGLPVSVLEAMYVGLPIVLSDIPQHREVNENNNLAHLLPLKEDIWIDIINRLSSTDKKELLSIGAKNRQYVKDNFSLESMHSSYSELYYRFRD